MKPAISTSSVLPFGPAQAETSSQYKRPGQKQNPDALSDFASNLTSWQPEPDSAEGGNTEQLTALAIDITTSSLSSKTAIDPPADHLAQLLAGQLTEQTADDLGPIASQYAHFQWHGPSTADPVADHADSLDIALAPNARAPLGDADSEAISSSAGNPETPLTPADQARTSAIATELVRGDLISAKQEIKHEAKPEAKIGAQVGAEVEAKIGTQLETTAETTLQTKNDAKLAAGTVAHDDSKSGPKPETAVRTIRAEQVPTSAELKTVSVSDPAAKPTDGMQTENNRNMPTLPGTTATSPIATATSTPAIKGAAQRSDAPPITTDARPGEHQPAITTQADRSRPKAGPKEATPPVAAQVQANHAARSGPTTARNTQESNTLASTVANKSKRTSTVQDNALARPARAKTGAQTTGRIEQAGGKVDTDHLKPEIIASKPITEATASQTIARASTPSEFEHTLLATETVATAQEELENTLSNDGAGDLPPIDTPLELGNVSEAFEGQLGERLVSAIRQDMNRAEIRITPDSLGPIVIDLSIDGDTASVSFSAEHAGTRLALQDSLQNLKDMLANEGINLGETHVNDGRNHNARSDDNASERNTGQKATSRTGSDPGELPVMADSYRPPTNTQGLVDLFV